MNGTALTKMSDDELNDQNTAICDELQRRRHEQNKRDAAKYVGRCFVYQNTYGSGDPWRVYGRVDGVEESGWCYGFTFQHTSHDIIEAQLRGNIRPGGGWTEISAAKFKAAYRKFIKALQRGAE